jgi:UPF0755 protein
MYSTTQSKPKKFKLGRYIVWLIVLIIVLSQVLGWGTTIRMEWQRVIKKWDTYYGLISDLGRIKRMRVKQWLRKHSEELPPLKPGIVTFSGSYTPQEWVKLIDESTGKPQTVRLTLLEWWSSYDIDAKLTELGLIKAGEYHGAITDSSTISEYVQKYSWLGQQYSTTLPSLEWYLYPDTYFIDTSKAIIPQVINTQLKAYQDKVRDIYGNQILWLSSKLKGDGYNFDLSPYAVMKLASVIENEEKSNANKPTIAGAFLNRIQEGMRLDADVTLCYGKAVTYEMCTPAFIVQNLYEESNPYNTRQVKWLPPTPISNPSVATIKALLDYIKSDYFYYLHDNKGQIYPATTVEQHNANKAKYL